MSGRPQGPYTLKKRSRVVGVPYRCEWLCAISSLESFVAA